MALYLQTIPNTSETKRIKVRVGEKSVPIVFIKDKTATDKYDVPYVCYDLEYATTWDGLVIQASSNDKSIATWNHADSTINGVSVGQTFINISYSANAFIPNTKIFVEVVPEASEDALGSVDKTKLNLKGLNVSDSVVCSGYESADMIEIQEFNYPYFVDCVKNVGDTSTITYTNKINEFSDTYKSLLFVYFFSNEAKATTRNVISINTFQKTESIAIENESVNIRTYDEILKGYSNIDYKKDYPYTNIYEQVKSNMPKFLRTNNDNFYGFVEKLLSHIEKMAYWNWILETQWWVDTAKGKFLDNIGRWLGMSRPPLPIKRTNEPVVVYPPLPQNTSMTEKELLEFNTLHGISSKEVGDDKIKDTFYPSRDFVGNVLVNDDEYRAYIKGLLRLNTNLDFINMLESIAHILTKPFFVVQNNRECLKIKASYEEDSVRLVIVRELTSKIRTTGFNIEVTQSSSFDDEEVKNIYGNNAWLQENPYIESDE